VDDRIMSSSWREMKALEYAIDFFPDQLYNRFVKIYSDNQNVIRILNQGSTKCPLQTIAIQFFDLCVQRSILLEIAWVPRIVKQTTRVRFLIGTTGAYRNVFLNFLMLNGVPS
jgi:hypothetical protein